jgi:hypothetical protein
MRKSAQKTLIATALTWALALPSFAGQLAAQERLSLNARPPGALRHYGFREISLRIFQKHLFYGTREHLQLQAMPHTSRSRSRWSGP